MSSSDYKKPRKTDFPQCAKDALIRIGKLGRVMRLIALICTKQRFTTSLRFHCEFAFQRVCVRAKRIRTVALS